MLFKTKQIFFYYKTVLTISDTAEKSTKLITAASYKQWPTWTIEFLIQGHNLGTEVGDPRNGDFSQ